MSTNVQQTTATLAIATLSGLAMGQSGLDLDRAYASELRSDAQTRSSLLGSSNESGINVGVMTQFRYTYNSRDDLPSPSLGDNDTTVGFATPRTQIRLSGSVTDNISGAVIFDFGSAENGGSDGSAELLVAQAAWSLDDNWTLLFGQWHNPVLGSEAFAAEHTLAADKSFTNEFFQVGYTQGVAVAYGSDNFKFVGAISDGAEYITNYSGVANSAFNSAGEADFGITGRFDYLVEGSWDQFADATSWRGSNYGAKIGAGLHWQTQGDTNNTGLGSGNLPGGHDETTVTFWTVDAQVEGDGWNAFVEYVGHKVDIDATTDLEYTNHGFIAQGGFFFSDQWEGFARYDMTKLDDVLVASGVEDTFHAVTVGANYYFVPESHAAKFTVDAMFTLEESTAFDTLGINDMNASGFVGTSDSEFSLRAQMTLVF